MSFEQSVWDMSWFTDSVVDPKHSANETIKETQQEKTSCCDPQYVSNIGKHYLRPKSLNMACINLKVISTSVSASW